MPFAFWLNAVLAVISTAAAIRFGADVSPFTLWCGGLHTGLAFCIAILRFEDGSRKLGSE